jgi:NADP-dependent 3-hydroxy acid dehydrogenase YdfG
LFDRGFRVFGSVRKRVDADRLSSEIGANFTPLLFDVTDEAAVLAAAREVRARRWAARRWIVMISSMAGKNGNPLMSAYSASIVRTSAPSKLNFD